MTTTRSTRRFAVLDGFRAWYASEHPLKRAAALWVVTMAALFAAWTVSYLLLPTGIAHNVGVGGELPVVTGSVATTALRIFLANAVLSALVVVGANTFRSVETPLGYVVVVLWATMYGVLLGTNSFGVAAPGRFAPSVGTLLARSGVFEFTGTVLIAAGTKAVTIWHQERGPRHREEFERRFSPRDWTFSRADLLTVLLGLLFVALGAVREATQIHHVLG